MQSLPMTEFLKLKQQLKELEAMRNDGYQDVVSGKAVKDPDAQMMPVDEPKQPKRIAKAK